MAYASPEIVLQEVTRLGVQRQRPLGITLLSILHFLGGAVGFGLVVVFVFVTSAEPELYGRVRFVTEMLGVTVPIFFTMLSLLCWLGIVASVAMWKGFPSGWYLGSFYYAYAIVRNGLALLTLPYLTSMIPPEEVAEVDVSHHQIKFGGRLIVSALLYLYFFKGSVREYFEMTAGKLWLGVAGQIGVCMGIIILLAILAT